MRGGTLKKTKKQRIRAVLIGDIFSQIFSICEFCIKIRRRSVPINLWILTAPENRELLAFKYLGGGKSGKSARTTKNRGKKIRKIRKVRAKSFDKNDPTTYSILRRYPVNRAKYFLWVTQIPNTLLLTPFFKDVRGKEKWRLVRGEEE